MTVDNKLIRIGGIFALLVAATQVVGNALHPVLPDDAAASLTIIGNTGRWAVVHTIITVSYFMFVPFVLGLAASFPARPAAVRIATTLVVVGAALGAAQITTHTTIFRYLGVQFNHALDAVSHERFTFLYDALWPYSVALEIIHLLAIYVASILIAREMLRNPSYRRWLAILGLIGGIIATAGILVSKFIITGKTGNLIFGFSLLPSIIWIIGTGVALLKFRPATVTP